MLTLWFGTKQRYMLQYTSVIQQGDILPNINIGNRGRY